MSLISSEILPTKILGHEVYFPAGKKPFPAQLAVMSKTLQALSHGKHALLESPTGTGKTLALLSSTLCFQRKEFDDRMREFDEKMKEESPSGQNAELSTDAKIDCNTKNVDSNVKKALLPKRPKLRKIYYCSRTHSQLKQVVNELKNCYPKYLESIKMCVLGSRSQLCINKKIIELSKNINAKRTLDDECRTSQQNNLCEFSNRITIGNICQELHRKTAIWDIEEVIMIGKKNKACPYYMTRLLMSNAQIILLPYNYILDEIIRKLTKIDLNDAIIIFDEAHNIEDAARSSASMEIPYQLLSMTVLQLRILSKTNNIALKSLLTMTEHILHWMDEIIIILSSAGSDVEYNVWTGNEILSILEMKWGITKETFQIYFTYFEKLISENEALEDLLKFDSEDTSIDDQDNNNNKEFNQTSTQVEVHYEKDTEDDNEEEQEKNILSPQSLFILKGIFKVLNFMFVHDHKYISEYRMVLMKDTNLNKIHHKKTRHSHYHSTNSFINNKYKLCFWCLSAAVVFEPISKCCRSLLLTSGTLSPLDSFSEELGINFEIRVEASHVINMSTQIMVGAIASVPAYDCTYTSTMTSYINNNNEEEEKHMINYGDGSIEKELVANTSNHHMNKDTWNDSSILHGVGKDTPLLSTYANSNNLEYYDALGNLLFEAVQRTPGGTDGFLMYDIELVCNSMSRLIK